MTSPNPAKSGRTLNAAVTELLSILDLESLEHNLYRGRSPKTGWQRVFGGQVIGQAMVAAQRTVPADRHIHSLHGYFMRPGDPAVPIIYEVDRIRDGGSFTTRRVVAIQHGKAIFSMSASFQIAEDGLDYFMPMPNQPDPDELESDSQSKNRSLENAPEAVKNYWKRERPIEMRATSYEHFLSDKKLDPEQHVWMRATDTIPDDQALHAAVLAYASDMTLLDTSLYPHGRKIFDPEMQVASLDHAMWFHRPINVNDWILFAQDSPNSSGARGYNRGSLYSRDGTLVASCVQEGLIRVRDPNRA
ncbi:acyl-CoA thioesterase II [Pseudahrensia aquimaris]|uniref:Acyl-CoA thioesterase II n=1 Tax=Pseudahrensia aquimaris TaxID=744461 RepID=A0ABW3FG80_9HYPH